MATPLDTGLLQTFSPVFIFILVFAVVYAIMDKFKLMGENKLVKLTISFIIGILFLFSPDMINVVNVLTPWFVVFVIAIMFLLSIFLFMGVREGELTKAVENPQVYWPVLFIAIIVFIIALIQVFGGKLPDVEESVDDRTSEGINAIVHPRLLGAIVLLVIASLAIKFISESVIKPG